MKPRGAFSLIELLAVIAIIGLLAALSVVAMNGIRAGRDLEAAASTTLGQISLARQNALTKATRTRWALISAPDDRNNDPAAFRKMRLEIFDPARRVWEPLGRTVVFPVGVVADPSRSTLLTNVASGATNTVTFFGNGRAAQDPAAIHSLTLFNSINTNNFITIQFDPVSGRSRSFQP